MSKFYVTTSIAYTNAEPHIGYAQELVAGDVLARFHRQKKDETFFLTGTDEHGQSVLKAAEKEGMSAEEYADKMAGKFQELTKMLNLSNDFFIRTTNEEHIKNSQELWEKANKNGDIYKKNYEGLYCIGCERLLNKSELVDGKCPLHPILTPEVRHEENWFFKLSAYREKLLKLYEENPQFVVPEYRFNEIKSLVNDGLEDVSVSRPKEKLNWGIEVPNDPSHVMYVWFDALTNYLYPKDFWPADWHIIGKDILRFHSALWPAMLMSAGMELPKQIFVHGFISVSGQKMSKTLGNVVKPEEMIAKFGVDPTRYLLMRELPFGNDSDFSWERMKERYNADLANDLGNLLQRTLTMINKYNIKPEKSKIATIETIKEKAYKGINDLNFSEALLSIWMIISLANKLIDDSKPWELAKTDQKKLSEVLNEVYSGLDEVAELLVPFMPETSVKMKKQLETLKPEALFPRLT